MKKHCHVIHYGISLLIMQNMQEDIYRAMDHYKNPASDKDGLYAQLSGLGITHINRRAIK